MKILILDGRERLENGQLGERGCNRLIPVMLFICRSYYHCGSSIYTLMSGKLGKQALAESHFGWMDMQRRFFVFDCFLFWFFILLNNS
jgi:hypothetical protein